MLPELELLHHFHFLRPAWALLLLPWLAMALMQMRLRSDRDMFGGIIAPHLLEHLRLRRSNTHWFNPRFFSLLFVVLALLVLLGPSWRQQPSPLSQDDAALVIVLDVSASMEQNDVQPSRLQRAKQKVSDLLALRPDKKAALVVYSGTAHTVLSLTADQDIMKQYLAAITPSVMPRSGKFPEYSLPLLDEILRESHAPATVVMFTDGLGADSRQPLAAYFAARPHQLLVVGVGTADAAPGLAPLDRKSLETLAEDTGGNYVALTIDDGDVQQLKRRSENHYVVMDDSALPWLDSGYPLLFPAMALFLLWFRKGWTITWACVLLPVLLSSTPLPTLAQDTLARPAATPEAGNWFADLWLTGDQQGRLLMQQGRYRQAAARFTEPMWKGMAYYYDEEFMLAAEYFSRRDSEDALFNEANARAHGRDYVRAVDRYDRLLARHPGYPGAAQNRAQLAAIIEEMNRLSASQMQEPGVSGEDKELDGDDAIPANGADEISWQQAHIKQLSAEDILQDPATSAMWLRSVQQDPSRFLAVKFSIQLQDRQSVIPPAAQDVQ